MASPNFEEVFNFVVSKLHVPTPYINNHESIPAHMLGLDAVIFATFFLTLIHSLLSKGFSTMLSLFVLAVIVEQLSIQLGQTHCHTDAVLMISKCSSLNSALFYTFWIYLSLSTAQAFNLGKLGTIGAVGVINAMFGLVYELQGPINNLWQYNSENVADAFDERFFGLPLMGVYFHMAFGSGFAATLYLFGGKNLSSSSLLHLIPTILFTPAIAMIYDLPVRVLKLYGVSRFASVPLLAALLFLLPFLLSALCSKSKPIVAVANPGLFFFSVFLFHAYFLAMPFWVKPTAGKTMTPELFAAVVSLTIVSLSLHYTAAFPCKPVQDAVKPIKDASKPVQDASKPPKENKKKQ